MVARISVWELYSRTRDSLQVGPVLVDLFWKESLHVSTGSKESVKQVCTCTSLCFRCRAAQKLSRAHMTSYSCMFLHLYYREVIRINLNEYSN